MLLSEWEKERRDSYDREIKSCLFRNVLDRSLKDWIQYKWNKFFLFVYNIYQL